MAAVLPARIAATNETAGQEGRARKDHPVSDAGIAGANRRICAGAWSRYHQRYGYADRYKPEHAQAALPSVGRKAASRFARKWPRCLVCKSVENY